MLSGNTGGLWCRQRDVGHINVLELRTVYMALKHFLPILEGQHVLCGETVPPLYQITSQGNQVSSSFVGGTAAAHLGPSSSLELLVE